MSSNPIVVFCGRKRTGKETAFKILKKFRAVEEFQFSTPLKKFCIEVLGLEHSQCYGNDVARESPTQYKWGASGPLSVELCKKYNKTLGESITARNILQMVGTDLIRNALDSEVWAKAGIRQINNVATGIMCAFTDTRFPNEVLASKETKNSISIRLYRDTKLEDSHDSETALDKWDVIPNQRTLIGLEDKLKEFGYISITPTLWKLSTIEINKFDFLIDNNSDTLNLEKDLKHLLRILEK